MSLKQSNRTSDKGDVYKNTNAPAHICSKTRKPRLSAYTEGRYQNSKYRSTSSDDSAIRVTPYEWPSTSSIQEPAVEFKFKPAFDYDASKQLRIGYYVIQKTLGQGSFGKVKLAKDLRTGETVALKILNRAKMKTMDVVLKTKREIALLARLKHKHVIRLHTVISTPSDIFMVMEYVSGGELFDYVIKKGKLSEKEGRRFFQQIISGIKYCHDHAVVHRDLKPENLLLDNEMNVKIADFGLSNLMEDGALLQTSCGSPNYAAPEVVSGRQYAGPEVDVWSCGIVLYALLTSRLPFDSDHVPTLFKKIESGHFYMQPYLSHNCQDLIYKMLTVDPMKRITITGIIKHVWFEVDLPTHLFKTTPIFSPYTNTRVDPKGIAQLAKKHHKSVDEVMNDLVRGRMHEKYAINDRDFDSLIKQNEEQNNIPNEGNGLKVCLPASAKYCSVDCDLCPRWGAPSCLFANRIQSLAQCDLCPRYAQKGCIFSTQKMNIEDFSEEEAQILTEQHFENGSETIAPYDANFKIGDVNKSKRADDIFSNVDAITRFFQSKERPKQRWHLGIRSCSHPKQIMHSLFEALQFIDFEWKILSPYKCYVRKRRTLEMAGEYTGTICLHLYKLKPSHYLLDFSDIADDDKDPLVTNCRLCDHSCDNRTNSNSQSSLDQPMKRTRAMTSTMPTPRIKHHHSMQKCSSVCDCSEYADKKTIKQVKENLTLKIEASSIESPSMSSSNLLDSPCPIHGQIGRNLSAAQLSPISQTPLPTENLTMEESDSVEIEIGADDDHDMETETSEAATIRINMSSDSSVPPPPPVSISMRYLDECAQIIRAIMNPPPVKKSGEQ